MTFSGSLVTQGIMIQKLYHALSKKYIVWASFLASLVIIAIFIFLDRGGRPQDSQTPLALQLTFSKDAFLYILEGWGELGIKTYKKILLIDYLFPITYSLFLASSLSYLTIKRDQKWKKLYLFFFTLPFASTLLDWCENTFHCIFLRAPTDASEQLIKISALCAHTKWILGIFSFLLVYYFWWKKKGSCCKS